MHPERQWVWTAAKEIASRQMGKHFHNGREQMLERDFGILEIFRHFAGGPEQPESCLEQGLSQWLPVMPPNPNYSESGRCSAPTPPEWQKGLVWLPGQPLGKPRMESTGWGSTCLRHRSLGCFWCCQAEQPLVQFNAGIQRKAVPEFVQIMQTLGSCSDTSWATVPLL